MGSPGTFWVAAVLGLLASAPALAEGRLPTQPELFLQTSGPLRCANIGDWYTTQGTGEPPACGPLFGDGQAGTSADRVHRFSVDISPAALAEGSGEVVVTVTDAESAGALDEVTGAGDPARYSLFTDDGFLVEQHLVESGAPDGTAVAFRVERAGAFELVAEVGAGPLGDTAAAVGDPAWAAGQNDDDNTFAIETSVDASIGVRQGTFQHAAGVPLDTALYFVVGPGAESLLLRNFDLDDGGVVTYVRPDARSEAGTTSGNAEWNGPGGDLNQGGDSLAGLDTLENREDCGVWRIALDEYTSTNQVAFEVLVDGERLTFFDAPPASTGSFVLRPDAAAAVADGSVAHHYVRVANGYLATDIINLTVEGGGAGFTARLVDLTGAALPDTDGDGRLDTGVLPPGQGRWLRLIVEADADAEGSVEHQVRGTSLLSEGCGLPGEPEVREVTRTTQVGQDRDGGVPDDDDAGDGDGVPGDRDGDGVPDAVDLCPEVPDPEQKDRDGDGLGDPCDPDANGDGFDDDLEILGGGFACGQAGTATPPLFGLLVLLSLLVLRRGLR